MINIVFMNIWKRVDVSQRAISHLLEICDIKNVQVDPRGHEIFSRIYLTSVL